MASTIGIVQNHTIAIGLLLLLAVSAFMIGYTAINFAASIIKRKGYMQFFKAVQELETTEGTITDILTSYGNTRKAYNIRYNFRGREYNRRIEETRGFKGGEKSAQIGEYVEIVIDRDNPEQMVGFAVYGTHIIAQAVDRMKKCNTYYIKKARLEFAITVAHICVFLTALAAWIFNLPAYALIAAIAICVSAMALDYFVAEPGRKREEEEEEEEEEDEE